MGSKPFFAPRRLISSFFRASAACSSTGLCLKGQLHKIVDRLFLFGNLVDADAVGGNHGRRHQRRIIQVARDGLLDDLLLVVERVLRTDERLLVRGHGWSRR